MELLKRGREIKKALEATYLVLKMTNKGITDQLNVVRGIKVAKKAGVLAEAARVDAGAAQQRVRYVIGTYLRSAYLDNAMMLPNLGRLEEIGDKVDRNIARQVLRCPERSLEPNKLWRTRALLQVSPLAQKVEKDAASFIKKLVTVTEEHNTNEDENVAKVRRHARRTIWLLDNHGTGSTLSRVRRDNKSEKEIHEEAGKQWNWAGRSGGPSDRKLPKLRLGQKPPLFETKHLKK